MTVALKKLCACLRRMDWLDKKTALRKLAGVLGAMILQRTDCPRLLCNGSTLPRMDAFAQQNSGIGLNAMPMVPSAGLKG